MKKTQNILIILANPETNSFSTRIAQQYRDAAQKVGKSVDTIDLYAPEWKQEFLHFDEQGKTITSEITQLMQEKVKWADELVFVFPVWRFDMPAILKNWLDHTMASGFAYKHKPGSLQPHKFLKGKTARIFCNAGGPTWAMKLALLGTWINWKFGRLGFVGIELKSFDVFGVRPRKQSLAQQNLYLQKVEKLAQK